MFKCFYVEVKEREALIKLTALRCGVEVACTQLFANKALLYSPRGLSLLTPELNAASY
jgi:hypothetical protein